MIRGEIMTEERCVCCGEIIPEGRQVCWQCEHEAIGHRCINCDKDIPEPKFVVGGRQNGKIMTILYYNLRQMCCSDQCAREWLKKIEEE